MKLYVKLMIFLAAASLLMAACVPNTDASTTALQTSVAKTVVSLQTQIAARPTATLLPTVMSTSAAEFPTFTAAPTLMATNTPIVPTATTTPLYLVSEIQNMTIPAGTVLKGGQSFVKTWRITNGGSAAWGKDFKIVYVSGEPMGITSITLGRVVNPGATYEVSVTFTAPVPSGEHVANFMMQTNVGDNFGLGKNATQPWQIRIVTQNVFAVTAASIAPSTTAYTGTCPASINLTPSITVNGSGTVTYYIRTSTGLSDTIALVFADSGTKAGTVVSWPVTATGTLLANIYIDAPNHQDFGVVSIPVTCTP